MLTVCLLQWNNYLGMGDRYVAAMRGMLSRHLTVPHEVVVVTERDITSDRKGWFVKLDLLEMFDGEVLYLDLDVILTGNIDFLVNYGRKNPYAIWARDDWSYPITRPSNGREATINSSVMYWSGRKDMTGAEELIPVTHGDQGIISQLFWPHGIELFPYTQIKSYKYDTLQGRGHGPICVCHGNPKPHELLHLDWVREAWTS